MNDTPGIGHNISPFDASKERVDELIKTANNWIEKVDEIQDEEQAGRANDFRKQLRSMKNKVDTERMESTAELRLEVEGLNAKFNGLKTYLDKAFERIGELVKPWLDKVAEDQRIEAEKKRKEAEEARLEAERLEREAAEKQSTIEQDIAADEAKAKAEQAEKDAEKATKAKPQVQGDLGGKATGFRTTWKAVIIDIDKVFNYYKRDPKVAEVLTKLASADARRGRRRIPGVDVQEERNLT